MSIRVTFKCGHGQAWAEGDATPVCATCGERQIGRVKAPAPRFSGACVGPTATTTALGPVAVSFGAKG